MISLLGLIGRWTLEQLAGIGRMVRFLFSAFAWTFRPPPRFRLIVYHIKTSVLSHYLSFCFREFLRGWLWDFKVTIA